MRISSCTAFVTVLLSSVTMTQAQNTLPQPRWMQAEAAVLPREADLQRFATAVMPAAQPMAALNPMPVVPSPAATVPQAPVQMPTPMHQPTAPIVLPQAQPRATVAPAGGSGTNPFRREAPAPVSAAPAKVDAFALEPAANGGAGVPAVEVDVRALRFYAAQRNLERVGAETRRLKAENPGWEPPADLFAPVSTAIDEQPLWDLYAAGNYGEMRRRIAQQQEASPEWHPSDEMSRKLTDGEGRARIMAAARYARWPEVVERAGEARELLTCSNIDIVWTVAEALAHTGRTADSFDLYTYAIANCGNEQERLATVQKAGQLLPPEGREALIGAALAVSSTPAAYEALRFDDLRAALGAYAAGETGLEVDRAGLERFATFIQAERSASDAGLLGWYFYAAEEFDAASAWFQAGMQIQSDPKLIEGAVLALRAGDKVAQAQDLSYRHRETAPEIAKLYIEIVSERLTGEEQSSDDSDALDIFAEPRKASTRTTPTRVPAAELRQFAETVLNEESALGAQALGWHLVAAGNLKAADEWFRRSVGWEASEGGVMGTAVIAARLKQTARLQEIKARYQADYPELADFRAYRPAPVSRVSSYKPRRSGGKKAVARPSKPTETAANLWQRLEFK